MLACLAFICGLQLSTRDEEVAPSRIADLPARLPPDVTCEDALLEPLDEPLPTMSIVIPYLRESWHHINTTLTSVLSKTNLSLVVEILLVDDANPPETHFTVELMKLSPIIRVVRNEKRQGLIRSKLLGVRLAKGDVVFFFEPHCIVERNWELHLLRHLAREPKDWAAPVTGLSDSVAGRPNHSNL